MPLVHTTGCHEQLQGLMLQYHAEVASGAIAPTASVDVLHHFGQAIALGLACGHSPLIPLSSIQDSEALLH